MKKFYTLIALSLLFITQIDAQLLIKRVGLSAGGDIEMPHGLDHKYILSTAVDNNFDVSSLPFEEGEMVRMDCDNGHSRLSFGFAPAGKKNTEIHFSISAIDSRIDMVRYELPEEDHFVEVSAVGEEVALEGLYLYRDQASKVFSFNLGIGTNVGFAHGGKVRIKSFYETDSDTDVPSSAEEIDVEYDQKNSINQRLFVQGGFGIRFLKRMEIGLFCRKGMGYRATLDGPFNFTTLKRSIGFNLNYGF